jgi:hypothetical protein
MSEELTVSIFIVETDYQRFRESQQLFLHAPVGFALAPEFVPSIVVLLDFVDGDTLESSLATVNVAQVDRILEHGTNLLPTILVTNNRTLFDVIHCGNSVSEF